MSWYIPREEDLTGATADYEGIRGLSPQRAAQIAHYAKCHRNLSLGWDFASALVDSKRPFPAIFSGDDLYVWRAYIYLNGGDDDVVEGAVSIEASKPYKTLRGQIRAMLVSDGVDCDVVAGKLGLDNKVVQAYEKLFFNVLDRKQDHAYIANLIYPEGRLVEAFEDYLSKTDLDALMMRAGYNHGIGHVLYAAGLGGNPYSGKNAAAGAADLDAMFMADGVLYGGMGWLHQAQHAKPIVNARLSMQASKMGGDDALGAENVLDFGDTIGNELATISRIKADAHSRKRLLELEQMGTPVEVSVQ